MPWSRPIARPPPLSCANAGSVRSVALPATLAPTRTARAGKAMFDPPQDFVPKRLLDQRVPMRDGVELSADIYLPPSGQGPWPAILQRTPYDNQLGAGIHSWPAIGGYFAARGYVLVSQDVRGR